MTKRTWALAVYKIFFGLLGVSAVVTEIVAVRHQGLFNPVNFFSYFTIQNNLIIAVALLLSALWLVRGKKSKVLDGFRGFSTTFILVVGIGFAVLLAGEEGAVLTAMPWDNIVLHYIIPAAAAVDLLIDRPRTKLSFTASLLWLAYPVAYLIYTLARGAATGWYPYPFLNPATSSMEGLLAIVMELLILGAVLIWGVTALSGYRRSKK